MHCVISCSFCRHHRSHLFSNSGGKWSTPSNISVPFSAAQCAKMVHTQCHYPLQCSRSARGQTSTFEQSRTRTCAVTHSTSRCRIPARCVCVPYMTCCCSGKTVGSGTPCTLVALPAPVRQLVWVYWSRLQRASWAYRGPGRDGARRFGQWNGYDSLHFAH